MAAGAQLTVTDMRRAARHTVDHSVIGEHRRLGDVDLHIINLSGHGFMTQGQLELGRGERVTIRLPEIGRIEAHMIWSSEGRSGFQFERIIRYDDFMRMIATLQPSSRRPTARLRGGR